MSETEPAIGDVFEYTYGSAKGKRIRLVRYFPGKQDWQARFSTHTIAHPASPQMVGQTSHVQAIRLTTAQFTYIAPEDARERGDRGMSEEDIIDRLSSLSSGALRRIADAAEFIIDERWKDGVFE